MDAIDLIQGYIASKHGNSVSDQFKDSYENDDFEDQNYNALLLVLRELNKIIKSKIITENYSIEIIDYRDSLKDYLEQHF